jgi:hypothetical protein
METFANQSRLSNTLNSRHNQNYHENHPSFVHHVVFPVMSINWTQRGQNGSNWTKAQWGKTSRNFSKRPTTLN